MKGISRRDALGGVAVAVFAGLSAYAPPALARARLDYPDRPMRLMRRLQRGLHGSATITVERAWQIKFAPQGQGLAITGSQITCAVDAPPSLAQLARIEESRSTADMFPILLSDDGSIRAAGDFTREADVAKAVREAEAIIASGPVPASFKTKQLQYLTQVQRMGSALLGNLPQDLFYPMSPASRAVQAIELPDGLSGEFEVTYEASAAPGRGWLERAERHVVTRIGGSERRSSEVWDLRRI